MGADNEVELFAAHRVVHLGWRMERAERTEDAATTEVGLALAQVERHSIVRGLSRFDRQKALGEWFPEWV